jgi:hypothetical protein
LNNVMIVGRWFDYTWIHQVWFGFLPV